MIGYLATLGLAVGLALDTAVVAAARAIGGRPSPTLPWLFGAAHGVMAALGWVIGREAVAVVAGWDQWVAFTVLVFLGARMLVGAARGGEKAAPVERGWELVVLTVATSIDALAAGLAIDALGVPPAAAIALIAGVCVVLTGGAMWAGRWVGARAGRWLEAAGGLMLVAVAVRVLVVHMS